MNHKYVTLGIAAIIAAIAVTSVGFAVPQQALAYHHHHNHNNGIKVDQQINLVNYCNGTGTACGNQADNHVDIDR